jgi:lysosomal acid lipase/cholesteryl ester hydrolase
LNPDSDVKFWDFSFVERQKDDQANINFIRDHVGQQKISVVAHSEATATFWVAMSEDPTWYEERVNILAALGPVSKLDNIKTLLLRTLGINGLAIGLIKAAGIHEFFYPDFLTKLWFKTTCGLIPQICRFSTYLISDGDTSVDDLSALRVYYGHYPAGVSIKALDHTLQIYMNKRFSYFDYGKSANVEIYGTEIAPLIDLSTIRGVPVAMFVGKTDLLGDPEDNEWLRDQLGESVVEYFTYDYGHITFFIGKDVSYINDLVFTLNQFNDKEQSTPLNLLKSSI